MINPAPTPAAERLAEAKRELKQVDRQIEAAVEHRRNVLLDGPAKSTAAVSADRDLAKLRLLRARLVEQIEVLPALISQQESAAAWPQTAALARTKLAEMRARLVQLQSKKKLDRSAADDAELDALIPGCIAMGKHAEFLDHFERASRAEVT